MAGNFHVARFETRGSVADLKREIIIAGGGLAGLSLAVALGRRGVAVQVRETSDYPRHRVCGEFISGVSAETLDHLGISTAFEEARRHRSVAWFHLGRLLHRDVLAEPALGISRHRLDIALRDLAVAAGAEVTTGVRARPEPREGFVWTAGRRPQKGRWIGLKAHFRGLPRSADLEMHTATNGYVGLCGVEDGWTNVCGLFRVDPSLRRSDGGLLHAYLSAGGNAGLADLLETAEQREGSFCAVAGFRLGRQPVTADLLALGDSQSMIAPFTGNGMSMAFQSAEIAAELLLSWSNGHGSWSGTVTAIRNALDRKFRRRLISSAALHPLLLSGRGVRVIQTLSRHHLLPFQPLLALVR